MKVFVAVSLVSFITLAMSSVQAEGLYIEPYLGYESGEIDYGTTDDDTKGIVYGFKLGYMAGRLGAGFAYGTGTVEVDATVEDDFEFEDMGAYLIYSIGMARVWANYIFDATGELDDVNTKYRDGKGLGIGVGFVVPSGVSLNIEKVERTYEKVGANRPAPAHEMNSLVFSVSIPFP
jgi:hypothetical protein